MAVELKDAADRYELLEKESQAKAADLKKAIVAAKETRSEIRAAKEELRQAGDITAGKPFLLRTKFVKGNAAEKKKISDLRTSPGPLWRLHTRFDLFRYRLVAQREVESMMIGGADPRS